MIKDSENDISKIPTPFINPAGDLSLYRTVSHSPDSSKELGLPGPDNKAIQVKIRGESWQITMNAENNAAEISEAGCKTA